VAEAHDVAGTSYALPFVGDLTIKVYLVSLGFVAAALLMGVVPRFAPLLYAPLYSGWFIWHAFSLTGGAPCVLVPSSQKTPTL
jgi:hypothetical protein